MLENVKVLSCVSGGSILGAHLAQNWNSYKDPNSKIAEEILTLVKRDLRGRIFRRLPVYGLYNILPPRLRVTITDKLRWEYKRFYRQSQTRNAGKKFKRQEEPLLGESVDAPLLLLHASNLRTGQLVTFNQKGVFSHDDKKKKDFCKTSSIPTSFAVAASSAFPGFFPPIAITSNRIHTSTEPFTDAGFQEGDPLTDGGVYDNLGFRGFRNMRGDGIVIGNPFQEELAAVDTIILSDAGAEFDTKLKRSFAAVRTPLRAVDILSRRLHDLEMADLARMTIHGCKVSKIDIRQVVDFGSSENRLYSEDCQRQLKNIRTDLDEFKDFEIRALLSHGYIVTAANLPSQTDTQLQLPEICHHRGLDPKQDSQSLVRKLEASKRRGYLHFPGSDPFSLVYKVGFIFLVGLVLAAGFLAWSFRKQFGIRVPSLVQTLKITYSDTTNEWLRSLSEEQQKDLKLGLVEDPGSTNNALVVKYNELAKCANGEGEGLLLLQEWREANSDSVRHREGTGILTLPPAPPDPTKKLKLGVRFTILTNGQAALEVTQYASSKSGLHTTVWQKQELREDPVNKSQFRGEFSHVYPNFGTNLFKLGTIEIDESSLWAETYGKHLKSWIGKVRNLLP